MAYCVDHSLQGCVYLSGTHWRSPDNYRSPHIPATQIESIHPSACRDVVPGHSDLRHHDNNGLLLHVDLHDPIPLQAHGARLSQVVDFMNVLLDPLQVVFVENCSEDGVSERGSAELQCFRTEIVPGGLLSQKNHENQVVQIDMRMEQAAAAHESYGVVCLKTCKTALFSARTGQSLMKGRKQHEIQGLTL